MMKGLFIVFEGIDGSGSSTQAELLYRFFQSKSIKTILTAEPTDGPIGQLIKGAMKKRVVFNNDRHIFDRQMAFLFAGDRHDHLTNPVNGILNFIEQGYYVISTRYYFSSFAYHCNREEDFEFVGHLNSQFPHPDIVIYLDNPLETSVKRIKTRAIEEVYESTEKLIVAKENYERAFTGYKGGFLRINSSSPIDEVHSKVINYFIENLYIDE